MESDSHLVDVCGNDVISSEHLTAVAEALSRLYCYIGDVHNVGATTMQCTSVIYPYDLLIN